MKYKNLSKEFHIKLKQGLIYRQTELNIRKYISIIHSVNKLNQMIITIDAEKVLDKVLKLLLRNSKIINLNLVRLFSKIRYPKQQNTNVHSTK